MDSVVPDSALASPLPEEFSLYGEINRWIHSGNAIELGELKCLDTSNGELLACLLRAVVEANYSIHLALPAIKYLTEDMKIDEVVHILTKLPSSKATHDVTLMVTVACLSGSFAYAAELINASATVLNLESLKKMVGAETCTVQLPITAGSIILSAIAKCQVPFPAVCKHLSESVAAGSIMHPCLLPAIALILRETGDALVMEHFVPIINRLLLRSSAVGLAVLKNVSSGLDCETLLIRLGDSLWSQLTSDNDESRHMALSCIMSCRELNGTMVLHKIGETFVGKSIKAKKTLAMLALRFPGVGNPLIETLLEKEPSDEVAYLLVLYLLKSMDFDLVSGLVNRINKAPIRSAFYAACASISLSESQIQALSASLAKKDTSPLDQILFMAAGAGNVDQVKAALKPGQLLSETNINGLLAKYPFLAMSRLLGYGLDVESQKLYWKLVLGSNVLKTPEQRIELIKHIGKYNISSVALAETISLSKVEEVKLAEFLCRLVLNSIASANDVIEFIEVAHQPLFRDIACWTRLSKLPAAKLDLNFRHAIKKLQGICDVDMLRGAFGLYPELAAELASQLLFCVAQIRLPSEEEKKICAADEKDLPIIDGIFL